jgi:hypothetical protein
MTMNDEQCISTPGQSNVKSSSISKGVLQIYRQNIQDIKWKSDEILDFFNPVFPHACIFVLNSLSFVGIDLKKKLSNDQDRSMWN